MSVCADCQAADSSPALRNARVTIRDVARLAGVSLGTASNVLNNPTVVAAPTRLRVLDAIARTGFVRSTAAHQLRVGRSLTVGVLLLDLANPFFAEMVKGAEAVLRDKGYVLMVCSSDESPDQERRYLRALEEHRVDGLLTTPVERDLKDLAALAARGIPTVLLDRDAGGLGLCSVTVDDVRGGELAASHLIALGHTVVAFVNGPLSIRQCADRRQGARQAFRHASLRPERAMVEITVPALSVEQGEKVVERLLASIPRPTAVMCANDLLALGVLRGLTAAGIAVPGEVALVGYDDVAFAAMLSPALSSVRQPKYELGASAAMLFLEEVSGEEHEHRSVRFEPELVVRASSGGDKTTAISLPT
ncbi:MAG: LacI family DNA-binding transcriptional regulator [Acidimicrobiales bacterium]|jgi:LacI family transcriptional regulator